MTPGWHFPRHTGLKGLHIRLLFDFPYPPRVRFPPFLFFFSLPSKVTSFRVDSGGLKQNKKEKSVAADVDCFFFFFFLFFPFLFFCSCPRLENETKRRRWQKGVNAAGAVVPVGPLFFQTLYIHRQYFLLFLFMIISGVQFVQVTSCAINIWNTGGSGGG